MLLVILACGLAAAAGRLLHHPVGGITLPAVWLPLGVLAAALAAADPRRWVGLLAGGGAGVLVALLALFPYSWPLAAALTLLTLAQAAATTALVRRFVAPPFTLARVAHVAAWTGAGGLVALAAGLAAAGLFTATGPAPVVAVWRAWSAASGVSLLLATPLALAWFSRERATADAPRRIGETVLVVSGAMVIGQVVFSGSAPAALSAPAYVLPFLLWAALRFTPGGAAATLAAVCLVGLWHTLEGHGPYTRPEVAPHLWVLRAQGVTGAIGASILLLAAAVAERNAAARESARLLVDLRQAMAEIKTLQGLIPICAWCHKVRNDGGLWQQIENYVQSHTDATFSHGICPTCDAHMQDEIAQRGMAETRT